MYCLVHLVYFCVNVYLYVPTYLLFLFKLNMSIYKWMIEFEISMYSQLRTYVCSYSISPTDKIIVFNCKFTF